MLVQGVTEPQPKHKQCSSGPDVQTADQASVCCSSTAGCRNSENRVLFLRHCFPPDVSMKTPAFVRAAADKPVLSTPHSAKPAAPKGATPRSAKPAAPK